MAVETKNYPLGIYTFKDIVEGGYFYVDKTGYVHNIANKYRYVFLSRPRRFGKSLLVDTLTAIKAYIASIPYYYENKTEPAFQTIMYPQGKTIFVDAEEECNITFWNMAGQQLGDCVRASHCECTISLAGTYIVLADGQRFKIQVQ